MHGYTKTNNQHTFLIHGGDKRSTNRLTWLAVAVLPLIGVLNWQLGEMGFWIGVGVSAALLMGYFGWMGSGQSERYEVSIDLDKESISAKDRKSGVLLWEDDFQPKWVRMAEIQVIISGEPYRHPALIYTEEPVDLVMDTTPTSTRTLLSLGETEELSTIYTQLMR